MSKPTIEELRNWAAEFVGAKYYKSTFEQYAPSVWGIGL